MLTQPHASDTRRALTMPDEIVAAASQHPEPLRSCTATSTPRPRRWGELSDESRRVVASLSAMGICPDDMVAIQLPNWRGCFVAHAAVWLYGGVLLAIVSIYGPHEVAFILRQSGARAVIIARLLRNRDSAVTLTATSELPDVAHRIMVGGALPGTVPFDELARTSVDDFVADPPNGQRQGAKAPAAGTVETTILK